MSDCSGLLRKFDDCAAHYSHSTISRHTDRVINPYVALVASLTPADLRPLMRRGAAGWTNGFWARWAFVTPPTDEYRTARFPAGERKPPPALIWTLRAWHERLGIPEVAIVDTTAQVGPPPVQTCPAAPAVFEAYYRYNDALLALIATTTSEDLDSSYARLPTKALRVAVLLASLENHGRIELHHWARRTLPLITCYAQLATCVLHPKFRTSWRYCTSSVSGKVSRPCSAGWWAWIKSRRSRSWVVFPPSPSCE